MTLTPNIPPIPPVIRPDAVFTHISAVTALAQQFLAYLHNTLNQLASQGVKLETPVFTPPTVASLPTIPAPPATTIPSAPEVNYLLAVSPPPNLAPLQPISTNFSSEYFAEPIAPTVGFPSTPVLAPVPSAPSSPRIILPSAPSAPSLTLPPVPTLSSLNIPNAPSIVLPAAPSTNIVVNKGELLSSLSSFDYLNTFSFVRGSLPDCKEVNGLLAKIEEMLLGGTGLPAAIEQQLLDRAVQKVEAEGLRAKDQALTEWSARGFTMPGAQVLAALSEIKNKTLEQKREQLRDTTIYIHEKYLESLRFAIQQGVALQGVYFDHCAQIFQICNAIAANILDTAKTILNARLEILRAEILALQARIDVFKAAVQGELSKLELYRGQLEAERLKGELNEQKVRIYTHQLQAVLTSVEIFKAQIAAYEANIRGELAKVEVFRAQVDAGNQVINQNRAKIELYDTQVRAETNKTAIFQSQVQAFEARVRAYQARVQSEATRVTALQNLEELKIRKYEAELSAYAKQVDAAVSKVNAILAGYTAKLEFHRTNIAAYTAQVDGTAKRSQQILDHARVAGELNIRNAELLLTKMKTQIELMLEKFRSLAQYEAQVGAAALAAVNASIGHHMQEAIQGSTNVHINYESDAGV